MLLLLSACDVVVCRCVLELHAIAARKEEGGGEFAVAMTAEERLRFLRGIKADSKEYYMMLGTVNAETSECSRPADRASIHDGIRSSVGFGKLSRMVFVVLEEWMEGQLRAQVASCEAAGDDAEATEWNHTLALVLMHQGRHADALAMSEQVLEFSRRALPANHPAIGEGCAGRDALHAVWRLRGDWSFCFILTCRHGHEQPCWDVQSAWKARGCACDG